MKIKNIFFTIIICLLIGISFDLVFAQNQEDITQQFLQFYQLSNNKIDNLINFIAMIAAVFGVIVAIVIGFFAIRQLSVDREIKAYKEEIRQQKELIKEEAIATKKELAELRTWTREKKNEIQKALGKPISRKTKQELKRLEEEIDKLREEIAFRQGSISTLPKSTDLPSLGHISSRGILDTMKICSNCKQTYLEDPYRATLGSQCPYCGHLNY
jgi:hypothetical protein